MKDAIFQFPTDGTPAECEQIKCGHINETYLITTDTGAKYVLQWVNQYVFPNVDAIMGNMSAISAYLRRQNERMSMISYIDTRAAVSFTNALGDSLQRLSIRVTDAGGALTVECLCPECNEDQGSTLHMRACGHYACSPGFDVAAHSVPECGIAGHCTVDGAAHGKCRNCQKPLCNGEDHGVGVCQHEHMWVQKSYTAATATTDGHSVAECMTCGIVYEQVFPATGG